MSNVLYWKRTTEDTWHKLQSAHPITYTRKQDTPTFTGGQCPELYNVVYSYNHVDYKYLQGRIQLVGPISGIRLWFGPIHPAYNIGDWNLFIAHNGRETSVQSGGYFPGAMHSNARIESVSPVYSSTDNCGSLPPGSCQTKFFTNGSLIADVTDAQCVEIADSRPDECECCSELLPKASAILSRLS